jgi:hypothetical protein
MTASLPLWVEVLLSLRICIVTCGPHALITSVQLQLLQPLNLIVGAQS